ncbi:MAG: hypothetical protein IIZ12_01945 [Eggerthellaceae bacterium]|nr:hypothetical protein [Eggerthellaceae bacterium]
MTSATEKHYRCIKSFELPKCDDDGMESEDGELLPVEVGDTFYRSEVSWMNDVRLEGVDRTWYWLEISEQTFTEHFEEVTR